MDRHVHLELTRIWAREEGFDDAEAALIAEANWACDRTRTGLRHLHCHWPLAGAPLFAWLSFRRAVRAHDLSALGEALHAVQDTIGHGIAGHVWHWPGIDRWEQRSERVRRRLERWTRRVLRACLRERDAHR